MLDFNIWFKTYKEDVCSDDAECINLLKGILGENYTDFVNKLGEFVKDKKFLAALRIATENGNKVELTPMGISVTKLRPTQNEIALFNSLEYPLHHENMAANYLKGGVVTVKGPIITGGGGKFIIDGHHRWSQLYVFNPNAQISAYDIGAMTGEQALKAVQTGIAAASGTVPSSSATEEGAGEGNANLLVIDQQTLKNYIIAETSPGVVKVFQQFLDKQTPNKVESFLHFYERRIREQGEELGQSPTPPAVQTQQPIAAPTATAPVANDQEAKQKMADHIWKNVAMMQTNNTPAAPAAPRDIMPQTDQAQGWEKATTYDLGSQKEHYKPYKEWLSKRHR